MFGPVLAALGAAAALTWVAATGFFQNHPGDFKKDPAYQLQELSERRHYPCASLKDPACREVR